MRNTALLPASTLLAQAGRLSRLRRTPPEARTPLSIDAELTLA